jgi:hypothetical protein
MSLIAMFFILISFRIEMFVGLWWITILFVMFVGFNGILRLFGSLTYMLADHLHKKSLESRCSKSWEEHLRDNFECTENDCDLCDEK